MLRVLGRVALGLVTLSACLLGLACASTAKSSADPRPLLRPAPAQFASADQIGSRWRLDIRSATTGLVLKRLISFGLNFTNNGPHGKGAGLLIERIAVANHVRRFVARGDQPSLSPNGRLLAYLSFTGPPRLSVQNLRTGSVRSIRLAGLIGPNEVPAETPAAWVRDGTALALAVTRRPVAVSGSQAHASGSRTSASQADQAPAKLLVVNVGPPAEPLEAHVVLVHGLRGVGLGVASDGRTRNSVLVQRLVGDTELIYGVSVASASATGHQLAHIRSGLILAFDPGGRRLLYLKGHTPPALSRGTIRDGRIVHPTRLLKQSPVAVIAW
jgi:hypothetical protein